MDSIIVNHSKKHLLRSLMKQKFAPWAAALISAIAIHVLVIELSNSQDWFKTNAQPLTLELQLLPTQAPPLETPSVTTPSDVMSSNEQDLPMTVEPKPSEKVLQPETTALTESVKKIESTEKTPPLATVTAEAISGKALSEKNHSFDPEEIVSDIDQTQALSENTQRSNDLSSTPLDASSLGSDRPALLDLSNISLPSNIKDETLTKIFSEELRDKIAESKKAQKEYLKGLTKEVDYPITEDADGTRYANIKGVCWRLPKEGSTEGWAIVFDGCGIDSKLFHFELNISPKILTNELLGPDSPFNIDQAMK